MKRLCELTYKAKAKELIANEKEVYYKHGVWNDFELTDDIQKVLRAIDTSGFGAEVYIDSKGNYYVTIPSDCDMW